MTADSNIYFLTLPENLDPDSYINQKGKDSFIKLSQSKIDIKEFIWNSYYDEIDKSNPQSLALFEKKLLIELTCVSPIPSIFSISS